ncbi:hypothetical protein, conserved [Trypanosoma brucei gambiense DAL972]|uniref:Uncharacterized protein n=2 Tax=Trypanosoma brucei TaxID=5691 RepID=C9ZNI9_TRYB9|nr:hypothetical protein, conserved [Trypanosoma brucei gambiense DAL972]RHW72311.1 hypothetical protein DPX39_050012800 [Trypanosoma brucei equiperdum]CBH10967.1 hypothetical protein, conserved [Trypanosoma brucei gambiense DAL972]|eukprot:XP_011773254.1 hypothetical protein, conserved [Trypanosoma brucei gambiense DAL972]
MFVVRVVVRDGSYAARGPYKNRSSCMAFPHVSYRVYSSSTSGALRPSCRVLRPQTIKPNPAHTPSGKFDRSFEKLSSEIENRMPFRQQQILFGSKYDRNFGEESQDELKKAAQDDLFGREPERAAARQARSYFTGDDLSPTALHVKSPRLKVSQLQHRQNYDKNILKTSKEADDYYYRRETPSERGARRRVLYSVASVVGIGACWGTYCLCQYMLE